MWTFSELCSFYKEDTNFLLSIAKRLQLSREINVQLKTISYCFYTLWNKCMQLLFKDKIFCARNSSSCLPCVIACMFIEWTMMSSLNEQLFLNGLELLCLAEWIIVTREKCLGLGRWRFLPGRTFQICAQAGKRKVKIRKFWFEQLWWGAEIGDVLR